MRVRRLAIGLLIAGLVMGGIVVVNSLRAAGTTGICRAMDDRLHQLVNPDSAGNLLAIDSKEIESAISHYGFADRGEVAMVSSAPAEGLVPVTRLRREGDFMWVSTRVQRAAAEQRGYTVDGPIFYGAPSGSAECLTAVYQVEQDQVHRIAVGEVARDALTDAGWAAPEIVFYAVGTNAEPLSDSGKPVPTGPAADPIDASDSDRRFTLAVVPDVQQRDGTDDRARQRNRVEWLVKSRRTLDLRFAVHTGDLVDWDSPDHRPYAEAAGAYLPLQAAVPWAVALGNHDTAVVCPGGKACADTASHLALRNTRTFNTYFPRSRFGALAGEFEAGKVDNAYHVFRAGGRDWMVLNLEVWPREEVLDWAAEVVADRPDTNVIVATHVYLDGAGDISDSNGGYGATSPQALYDRVVSRYPNVKLVLSGHTGKTRIRTDTTTGKNRVVAMTQSFRNTSINPVRMIEIDTVKNTVRTWVYVPKTGETLPRYSETIDGLDFVR